MSGEAYLTRWGLKSQAREYGHDKAGNKALSKASGQSNDLMKGLFEERHQVGGMRSHVLELLEGSKK